MFVPGAHARLHIGIGGVRRKKPKQARRKVGAREIMRMPCLMPTVFVVCLGLLVLAGGAGMCVLGYIPDTVTQVTTNLNPNTTRNTHANTHTLTTVVMATKDARYYATRSLSYAGPVLMGCGFFVILVACVLYCEIVDRYALLLPSKPQAPLRRRHVLDLILREFKKSYFRGIEVPLRKELPAPTGGSGATLVTEQQQQQQRQQHKKRLSAGDPRRMETLLRALSISTPVLLMSPDLAPSNTWRLLPGYPHPYRPHLRHMAHKPRHPKLKLLGGGTGGAGGGTGGGGAGGGGDGGGGREGEEKEAWLKTSSLPNIWDPESLQRGRHHHHHQQQQQHQPTGRDGCSEVVGVQDSVQESVRAKRLRRFARPSCSMDGKISMSLPQELSESSPGIDNPAYLHEKIRRRSLSVCMHLPPYTGIPLAPPLPLPPPPPRGIMKPSQLQPRERLQQLQQKQIHKQRQLLIQQRQDDQQQEPKKSRRVQRRDSEKSRGSSSSRRRDSDEPRISSSRQRPKLGQTRGAHKTFDSSSGGGVVSPTSSCPPPPSDPPPFPLPAHFMLARPPQPAVSPQASVSPPPPPPPSSSSSSAGIISSRTARLLRARCQSLDVKDKRRPDIMLLKDLFRASGEVQGPPASPPQLPSSSLPAGQGSTSSIPCSEDSREQQQQQQQRRRDDPGAPPPGGRQESVAVTVHTQRGSPAAVSSEPQPQGSKKKDSAVVRVVPPATKAERRGKVGNVGGGSGGEAGISGGDVVVDVIRRKHTTDTNCLPQEPRYELPLLSGVARASRQWEAERHRKVFQDSDHKSFSLDSKSPGPGLPASTKTEAARSRVRRSTSFKSPLAQEEKRARCRKEFKEKPAEAAEKGDSSSSSSLLRVAGSQAPKVRPSSWGGGGGGGGVKCTNADSSSSGAAPVNSTPVQPSCPLLLPLTSQTSAHHVTEGSKQTTTLVGWEADSPSPPYPCEVVYESERRACRTASKPAVGGLQTDDPQCLRPPSARASLPHNDQGPADRATPSQPRQHPQPQPHPRQLVVPAQVHSHLQSSPKYLDPLQVEQTLKQPYRKTPNKNDMGKTAPSSCYELSAEDLSVENRLLGSPGGKTDLGVLGRQDCVNEHGSQRLGHTESEPQPAESHQQREVSKRRSTIIHRASVHLSLDSYADSSMSITSSTVSSTDNTNSSNIAPILPHSPATTSHSPCSVGGGGGDSSGGGGGVEGTSTPAQRRMKFIQSRSVAVEELSGDDDDEETEVTPLIHAPLSSTGTAAGGKS